MINIELLKSKFFTDPDWVQVEELINSYIEPLLVMKDVDTSQPAEHVKAEIIARQMAYDNLKTFLGNAGILNKNRPSISSNSFK